MAILKFMDKTESIVDDQTIQEILRSFGVTFERWLIPANVSAIAQSRPSLSDEEKQLCLDGLSEKLDELNRTEGYCHADLVVLHPETPGLDTLLAKFDKEHLHTDDEVRFILDGRGVFGFAPDTLPLHGRFTLEVSAGEYIVVPANAWHWFELCDDKRIKAVRIFKDMAGWVPHYRTSEGGG